MYLLFQNRFPFLFLFFFLFLFISKNLFSAACCGGSTIVPALIQNDDLFHLGISTQTSNSHSFLTPSGKELPQEEKEAIYRFRFDVARIFWDDFQFGISLPYVIRTNENEASSFSQSAAGIGDLTCNFGFEVFSDSTYSPWIPKTIAFLQLRFPTGRSAQNAQNFSTVNNHGQGFYTAALGFVSSKTWGNWDAYFLFQIQKGLPKLVHLREHSFRLTPGWQWNNGIGIGFLPGWGNLRLGISLSSYIDSGVTTTGALSLTAAQQILLTPSFGISYLINRTWFISLSYQDDTLLSFLSSNSSLYRGFTLLAQWRFER